MASNGLQHSALGKLPVEIRVMIWEQCLKVRGNIYFETKFDKPYSRPGNLGWKLTEPLPKNHLAIVETCKEVAQEAAGVVFEVNDFSMALKGDMYPSNWGEIFLAGLPYFPTSLGISGLSNLRNVNFLCIVDPLCEDDHLWPYVQQFAASLTRAKVTMTVLVDPTTGLQEQMFDRVLFDVASVEVNLKDAKPNLHQTITKLEAEGEAIEELTADLTEQEFFEMSMKDGSFDERLAKMTIYALAMPKLKLLRDRAE